MQMFIAIHNNGVFPSFTSFPTIEAAEAYLNELLTARRVSATDSLAIVRASDDKIVYFRQQNNTVNSLRAGLRRRASIVHRLWTAITQRTTGSLLVPVEVPAYNGNRC